MLQLTIEQIDFMAMNVACERLKPLTQREKAKKKGEGGGRRRRRLFSRSTEEE